MDIDLRKNGSFVDKATVEISWHPDSELKSGYINFRPV